MERVLPVLDDSGGTRKLVEQLRTTWPDAFAQSLADRHLCAAVGVFRWLVSIMVENGSRAPEPDPETPNPVLDLALADFPAHADAEVAKRISAVISDCARTLTGLRADGHPPDVLDLLESPAMKRAFWSRPSNLLWKPRVWDIIDGRAQPQDIPIENVPVGCVRMTDPDKLAEAVQEYMGLFKVEDNYDRHYSPAPPDFIRFFWDWDNTKWAAENGDSSPFDAIQSFEFTGRDAHLGESGLVYRRLKMSYRLVCVARIPSPGEELLAEHLYTCDGWNFLPTYGNDRRQDWSGQESGLYYAVYYKSTQVRGQYKHGSLTKECSDFDVEASKDLRQHALDCIEERKKRKALPPADSGSLKHSHHGAHEPQPARRHNDPFNNSQLATRSPRGSHAGQLAVLSREVDAPQPVPNRLFGRQPNQEVDAPRSVLDNLFESQPNQEVDAPQPVPGIMFEPQPNQEGRKGNDEGLANRNERSNSGPGPVPRPEPDYERRPSRRSPRRSRYGPGEEGPQDHPPRNRSSYDHYSGSEDRQDQSRSRRSPPWESRGSRPRHRSRRPNRR